MRTFVLGLFWLLLAGSALQAADKPTQGLRYPSLTPDGKSVVFCYRGDIWVAPVDGKGRAQRLTIHEEQDTLSRVSPDGKQVAFASKRNGNYDLFVVPIEGGEPKQLTFHTAMEIPCDWSPDGKKILFMSNRDLGRGRLDLYELDLDGGTPRRVTFDGGRDGSYSADGSQIVYARGFNTIYWDNYTGSANYDLYLLDAKGGTPRRLTDTDGNERYPCFSRDGKTVYFVAEEKGVANFYSMPGAGGKRTQVTKYKKNDVQRPDLGWDYRTVVFEIVGRLYTADLTAPKEKPTPIPLSIRSDVRNSGLEMRTITGGGEQVHVSADGTRVAFSLRGDIWVMPATGGSGRRLTDGPEKDEWPRFSPDGATIAFFSRRRDNSDIFLLDPKSGRTTQVTRNTGNDFYHSWSPDGTKLVFASDRTGNREIWTIDVESKQLTRLTHEPAADDDPVFSPDGRRIAFDSGRGGTQAIYVMDADGSDVRRVTAGAGFFQVPTWSPDGKFLCFEAASPATGRSSGLRVISSAGGPAMQITRDGSTASWSPRGDYIYFTANRGPHDSGVFRVRAPESILAGERVPFVGQVKVDLRKELETLFDEAWLALKNGFYDPKMHKVDWNAMKTKYRAMAIDAENKDEFHNVVRQMLAELGASHLGIGGGQRGANVAPAVEATGYLGLDFEQAPLEDGTRRVARIVAGGPAEQAGLRVGDVVTKIGGKKLKKKTNLDRRLAGTVGKDLPVAFRPRTGAGLEYERPATLAPIDARTLGKLLYREWVATAKRRVEQATKGKGGEVGYVHLAAMNPPNLQKFQQAVQAWNSNKKIRGMILDVRDNGGGNIHQQLIAILTARPLARVRMRGRGKAVQPGLYWDKPVVVLINERSFSDAEVFPFMFKAAKIGKVIGVPTGGGVIGTNNITLSDGSSLRIPRTKFEGMDGTNLEGLGVKPDIFVEETAEDRLSGRDPQLAKAIEVVLSEIAERKKTAAAQKKKQKKQKKQKSEAKKEAEKPAKPAKPAPQPVKPELAGARNPLADARVGEWVRYRMVSPDTGEETVFKLSVARVANGTVFLEKEIEKGRAVLPPLPDKVRQGKVLEVLPAFGQVLGHTVIQAEVRGETTALLRAQIRWPDGSEIQVSFTNAVPALGLFKVELGKLVLIEAIEWGSPKPAGLSRAEEDGAPAAGAPAAETEPASAIPPHPVRDAEVGEWVRLKAAARGDKTIEMTRRVVEVTDDEVVIQVTLSFMGQERELPLQTRPRSKLLKPLDDSEAEYSSDTVTIGGETLACIVMTYMRNGAEEKVWVSPKIPVTGVVRVERDGVVVLELVEWGKDDD